MTCIRSRDLASTASIAARSVGVEREIEDAGVVGDVLRHPEPRADDDRRHRRLVEDIAHADIGDADAMLVGDRLERRQQFLEQCPAAPGVDHVLVFLQRRGAEFGALRLGTAQIFFRQQSAEHGAVGQQGDRRAPAKSRHPRRRAAVDQRILHLVRDDANAVLGDDAQTFGVEIGHARWRIFPSSRRSARCFSASR